MFCIFIKPFLISDLSFSFALLLATFNTIQSKRHLKAFLFNTAYGSDTLAVYGTLAVY